MASKWTSTAGPIQTKKAARALDEVVRERSSLIEVNGVHDGRTAAEVVEQYRQSGGRDAAGDLDFRVSTLSRFPTPAGARPEVTEALERLGARYDWTITRENYQALILDAAAEATALRKSRPIEDKRREPEEEARIQALRSERQSEQDARETRAKAAQAVVLARKPAPDAVLITAEYHRDDSHIQSDYFGKRTLATFAIGWRFGKREDFRQLRAAAEAFFGRPDAPAIQCDGHQYGSSVCPHGSEGPHAVAPEWAAEAIGALTEHRDNHSMGAGNYLSTFGWQGGGTGWTIQSTTYWSGLGEIIDYLPDPRDPEQAQSSAYLATREPGSIVVRPSQVRAGYVEVAFAEKPAPEIIAELKGAGFRWALRARCWYGPESRLPERYKVAA